MREAFFLYLQHQMSGFGGRWSRPTGSELRDYPECAAARKIALAKMTAVSNFGLPVAIAPIVYTDAPENSKEIKNFQNALTPYENTFIIDIIIMQRNYGMV